MSSTMMTDEQYDKRADQLDVLVAGLDAVTGESAVEMALVLAAGQMAIAWGRNALSADLAEGGTRWQDQLAALDAAYHAARGRAAAAAVAAYDAAHPLLG